MISTLTVAQQWRDLASGNVSESVLPARPFQLLTLWDMLRFEAHWFYQSTGHLNLCLNDISKAMREEGRDRGSHPTENEIKQLEGALNSLSTDCDRLGMKRAQEVIRDIRMDLKYRDSHTYVTLESLHRRILDLKIAIARDLEEQVFMAFYLPDIEYYEQKQLFGSEVFVKFESARPDVSEAGNCYAMGRYTACVFHCMRVVEKGLHALVGDLNSRFGASVVFNRDIEYINWGNIIDKIEAEIRKLLDPNRKPRLAPDDLRFYSESAKEFVYLKNAWRDDVSHSRSEYDQPTARSVMDHVKAFMVYLADQGLTE